MAAWASASVAISVGLDQELQELLAVGQVVAVEQETQVLVLKVVVTM